MKFLVLMAEADHADKWDGLDEAGQEAVFARFRAFTAAVRERGQLLATEAMERPASARTVRQGDGPDRPVTDGPFAETVEHLGGLWVVDLPDLGAAVDAAKLLPAEYAIEVRPLMDIG